MSNAPAQVPGPGGFTITVSTSSGRPVAECSCGKFREVPRGRPPTQTPAIIDECGELAEAVRKHLIAHQALSPFLRD